MTNNQTRYRALFVLVGTLVTAIFGLAVYIGFLMLTTTPDTLVESEAQDVAYTGVTIREPAKLMPDFTLTSEDGDVVSLRDLRGKPVLLTFGFTHCPDICPLTLGEMRGIHAGLGEQGDDLQFVFISVDGERDTPEVLKTYLDTLRVDDFTTALTGEEAILREIVMDYGATFIYGERDPTGHYSVDHTAGMFLLDENNQWIRRYAYGTDRGNIIQDIQFVLADS